MTDADDFKVPDLTEAVAGWRTWQVEVAKPKYGSTLKLMSATQGYYWKPRIAARADCHRCGDDLPASHCTCGFYSAKTLEHLLGMAYHYYDMEWGRFNVIGEVACWGNICEGSQGWRSEYAYPRRLWVPYEAWKHAKPLSETYGVPVRLLNFLKNRHDVRAD